MIILNVINLVMVKLTAGNGIITVIMVIAAVGTVVETIVF
jgi:hypothetical protein